MTGTEISKLTPGTVLSSATSPQVSAPDSGSNRAGQGGPGQDPGEDNNYGFPLRLGRAGVDFPIFSRENIPETSFSCEDKADGG